MEFLWSGLYSDRAKAEVMYVHAVEFHDIAFRAILILVTLGVFEEYKAESSLEIYFLNRDGVVTGYDGAAEDVLNVLGFAIPAKIAQEQGADRGAESVSVHVVVLMPTVAFV